MNSNTNDRRHNSGVRWRYAAAGLIVVCIALYVGSMSVFRSSIGESKVRPCETGCASPSPLPQLTRSACDASNSDGINNTEAIGRFQFPPSASDIVSSCFGMQGWGLFTTFTMAANDLMVFQASTQISEEGWAAVLPAESRGVPSASIIIASENLTSLLYGIYSSGGFQQEILIDTSATTLYRVQVTVFGG